MGPVFSPLSHNHYKMYKPSRKEVFLLFAFSLHPVVSQLALGAGTGTGSCRAFPFRAAEVDWDVCPPDLPCCNEYGYCRSREEWGLQNFRDCNGVSNGIELPNSVLELENALGGDPGPGLGVDSDFDKKQLEKVGSGSPAQRVNPFAAAPSPVANFDRISGGRISAGGGISAGGRISAGGKAEDSLLRPAAGLSSSRGSSRRRRPTGNQASSGSGGGSRRRVAAKRRQQSGSQGSRSSQRSQSSQGSKLSSGRQKGERIPAPRNPIQKNPPQTSFTRINTPRVPATKFVSRPDGNVGNLVAEVFSASVATPRPIQRPRLPARTNGPSRPRPSSAGRPRPRPATLGSRPLREQSNRATTRQVTGSGQTSFSNKSNSIASSSSRSKTTGSRTTDAKATDLYPLAGYKNTAGYPMNLNAENCPNYPFCYWNPYAAGAKD